MRGFALHIKIVIVGFALAVPVLTWANGAAHTDGAAHLGHEATFHEEAEISQGVVVNLNATPVPFRVLSPVRLDFLVNIKPEGGAVRFVDLEVEHNKLMHVVGVRSDLSEFFHIHPKPSQEQGKFSIDYGFRAPGLYKLWSEIKKDGINHIFGYAELSVGGDGVKYDKKISAARNVIVGDYQAALEAAEPIVAGREHDLSFTVKDLVGDGERLESYLGEEMHLVAIKDDLSVFIHGHPSGAEDDHAGVGVFPEARAHGAEGIPADTINFHLVFPANGFYKLFAQFRPESANLSEEEALVAEFWIEVGESKAFAISSWWTLLAVSLILIGLLSWGVKKFLKVDPKKLEAVKAE